MFGIKVILDEEKTEINILKRSLTILKIEIIQANIIEYLAIYISIWVNKQIIRKKTKKIIKIEKKLNSEIYEKM